VKSIVLLVLNLLFVPILERTAKQWTYARCRSELQTNLESYQQNAATRSPQQMQEYIVEQRRLLRQLRNFLRSKNHEVIGATYTPVVQLEDGVLLEVIAAHTSETIALIDSLERLEPNLSVRAKLGRLEVSLRCGLMMWLTPLTSATRK
jgi:hypothetical protein